MFSYTGKPAAPSAQILRQRGRAGAVSVQRRARLLVLRQLTAGLPLQLQQALFEHSVAYVLLGVAEQQHAQHRGKRRDHQPRDAHAVVHVLIEQVDHHDRGDQQGAAQVVGQQVTEPAHQAEERPELQHQQHQHQPKAAEDGVDEPFLAFTEQTDAAVLKYPDLASHGVLQCFF